MDPLHEGESVSSRACSLLHTMKQGEEFSALSLAASLGIKDDRELKAVSAFISKHNDCGMYKLVGQRRQRRPGHLARPMYIYQLVDPSVKIRVRGKAWVPAEPFKRKGRTPSLRKSVPFIDSGELLQFPAPKLNIEGAQKIYARSKAEEDRKWELCKRVQDMIDRALQLAIDLEQFKQSLEQ